MLTTAIRQCLVLLALLVSAAVFTGTGGSTSATNTQVAAPDLIKLRPVKQAISARHHAGSACMRHKAHSHHVCPKCIHRVIVGSFNRNRGTVHVLPPKGTKTDAFAKRLALEAENASVRLILAYSSFSEADPSLREVIARTARLRI